MESLERERTFEIPISKLDAVRAFLWFGEPTLALDGTLFHREKVKGSLRAYFVLETSDSALTDRVVVWMSGKRFRSKRSPKVWRTDDGMPSKYHVEESKIRGPSELAALLASTPIVASFVKAKEKARFVEDGRGTAAFEVSLDRIMPFAPDEPAAVGRPFAHVEFEAVRDWSPDIVLRRQVLPHPLSDLRLSDRSKADLSRMGPPRRLDASTTRLGLGDYLASIRRHVIDPLLALSADHPGAGPG